MSKQGRHAAPVQRALERSGVEPENGCGRVGGDMGMEMAAFHMGMEVAVAE